MSEFDSRTKLEAFRDQFETFGKGANYLLLGHGAGFVGCLSLVTQHQADVQPEMREIGRLILLFGTGLLLAGAYWLVTMSIKINVSQQIIAQERWTKTWSGWLLAKFLQYTGHLTLWGSVLLFAAAIILIMYHFRDAIAFDSLGWWRLHPS